VVEIDTRVHRSQASRFELLLRRGAIRPGHILRSEPALAILVDSKASKLIRSPILTRLKSVSTAPLFWPYVNTRKSQNYASMKTTALRHISQTTQIFVWRLQRKMKRGLKRSGQLTTCLK